jgi:hypothetical protein
VPAGVTESTNPIDAFVAAKYRSHGLTPVDRADRSTLLRRVYLDLVGIPPTPSQQEAFLNDTSPDAYEKVVDELLASEQHGVRYARRWLDVLRYADVEERMLAAEGIHLWRDWIINALNDDVPYDQFVRAQLTGYRSTERTQMSATGHRSKIEPRPDDLLPQDSLHAALFLAMARAQASWRSVRWKRSPRRSWGSPSDVPSATIICMTPSRSVISMR